MQQCLMHLCLYFMKLVSLWSIIPYPIVDIIWNIPFFMTVSVVKVLLACHNRDCHVLLGIYHYL